MIQQATQIGNVEALIIGEKTDKVFLFVHGYGGNKEEAVAFAEHIQKEKAALKAQNPLLFR